MSWPTRRECPFSIIRYPKSGSECTPTAKISGPRRKIAAFPFMVVDASLANGIAPTLRGTIEALDTGQGPYRRDNAELVGRFSGRYSTSEGCCGSEEALP